MFSLLYFKVMGILILLILSSIIIFPKRTCVKSYSCKFSCKHLFRVISWTDDLLTGSSLIIDGTTVTFQKIKRPFSLHLE